MQDKLATSNNTDDNSRQGYNICAGKGCNKIGNNHLKVIFIEKFGFFCDCCKEELTRLRLIEEVKHVLS